MDIIHIEWMHYHQRCVFSVLELDVRYDWWVMGPNTYESFFPISYLCVLICITKPIQVVYGHSAYHTTTLNPRHFLCCLELHERSNWRATAPDMHRSISDTTLCAYTASLYIQRYFILLWSYVHTYKYLMTAYYTLNDRFTTNNPSFYKNKVR